MNRSDKFKYLLGGAVVFTLCVTFVTLHIASKKPKWSKSVERSAAVALPLNSKQEPTYNNQQLKSGSEFWKTANMFKKEIPSTVTAASDDIAIHTGHVHISQGSGSVFYQYTSPPEAGPNSGIYVLLLHGAAFSSQNWNDIGTLSMLAAMGHTAVAVDIPGFGRSTGTGVAKNIFITSLIEDLREQVSQLHHLSQPVLVSPSMSGQYSMALLVADANKPDGTPAALSGFVAVAPTNTNELLEDVAKRVTIPTLIVRGSRDTSIGTTAERHLSPIPSAQRVVIDGAGHAAYMNQPSVFHLLLYNFIELILEHKI